MIMQTKLIWSGHPKFGVVFRVWDSYSIILSLAFPVLAFYDEVLFVEQVRELFTASYQNNLFFVFNLFYVILIIWFLYLRFLADILYRRHSQYSIEEKGVRITCSFPWRRSMWIDFGDIESVDLVTEARGTQNIVFNRGFWEMKRGNRAMARVPMNLPKSFECVENAFEVRQIILSAMDSARADRDSCGSF
ncbi:MAG: hypothetical protein ACK5JO_14390 [Halodesulfovibrio sp.]